MKIKSLHSFFSRGLIFLLLAGIFLFNTSSLPYDRATRPGKDFALFFAINDYDYWDDLANPISDVEAIAKDLKELYGFKTEIVRNPGREAILKKIEEYRKKAYNKEDQLLIFFSGHGEFNESTKLGYFVPKDGEKNDFNGDSYIEYEGLKRRISSLSCEHIMLALDACYSGTADENIAMKGKPGNRPKNNKEREQYISVSLKYKTRLMVTSGGKVRTPDKSQFVAKFLEALRSQKENDQILNSNALIGYLTTALPKPIITKFGDDEIGSDFLFIRNDNAVASEEEPDPKIEKTAPIKAKTEPTIKIDPKIQDSIAWVSAKRKNTTDSYEDYLRTYPSGLKAKDAKAEMTRLREDQSWAEALNSGTIAGYEKYCNEYSKGKHLSEAKIKINEIRIANYYEKNEVFISYGFNTSNLGGAQSQGFGLLSPLGERIRADALDHYSQFEIKGGSAFGLGYNRYFKKKAAIGLAVSYESLKVVSTQGEVTNNNIYTFIARYNFAWLTLKKLNLFSVVGLGVSINKAKNSTDSSSASSSGAALQLSLLGIRYNGIVTPFVELGMGSCGMIFGGIAYRFNTGPYSILSNH